MRVETGEKRLQTLHVSFLGTFLLPVFFVIILFFFFFFSVTKLKKELYVSEF